MSSGYSFAEVQESSTWDRFIERSPQSTIFSTTLYLKSSGLNYKLFLIQKGSIIHGGVLIILDDKGENIVADDLIVYNGIFFVENMMNQSLSKRSSFEFEVTQFAISQLVERYKTISLALATTLRDLRPFLWHNYGQSQNTFKLDLRYTSEIQISEKIMDEESCTLFMNLGTSRRQEIRAARKANCTVKESQDINLLINLYIKNMTSKGISLDSNNLDKMRNIGSKLLNDKKGNLFVVLSDSGECESAALFAHHQQKSYYLWGASDPENKNNYTGTIILWDSFKVLSNLGIKIIDLEGVNSPKRGWFKLSFGGELIPYYEVHYKHQT